MNEYYKSIIHAWKHDVCNGDICTMIYSWIIRFKDTIKTKDDIQDITNRIIKNDLLKDIVNDFIFGERYKALRIEFSSELQ